MSKKKGNLLYHIRDKITPDRLTIEQMLGIVEQGIKLQAKNFPLKNKKIGILAGSRGIRNIKEIIGHTVKVLKNAGAEVVILPAMGSHGGATAEGQKAVLAGYGLTEEFLGVPVISNMQVEQIGYTDNKHPVYVDKKALTLDGVIPVNRIKAHTDFHGSHESGLVKMMAIGIGKRAQAEAIHRHGIKNGLLELIPKVAEVVLGKVPLFAAVALLENKFDETAVVEVLGRDNLFDREKELLQLSKKLLPQIPFENLDVLVLSRMGKSISGVGIDPNVTKRIRIGECTDEPGGPYRIVALDLTEESDGNALGMGIADVISKRLYDKVDFDKTYTNTITSGFLERCFVPVVMPTDRKAVHTAMNTCGRAVDWEKIRMVFLKDTLSLDQMYISPALLKEVPKQQFEVSQEPLSDIFNADETLVLPWD